MKKKNIAFTLAEMMLVMGIIGIVSMIALPALQSDMEQDKSVALVKKSYVDLQNASIAMITEKGPIKNWFSGNVTADAASTTTASNFVQYLSGAVLSGSSITLKNGAKLTFSMSKDMAILTDFNSKYYPNCVGTVSLDINGPKGPNTAGHDIFEFAVLSNDAIEPSGINGSGIPTVSTSAMAKNTAWVVKAGNMDYLNCSGLSWNSKRNCN